METFMKLLETIQTFVWGPPTLVLLMGTGLYFTYKYGEYRSVNFQKH